MPKRKRLVLITALGLVFIAASSVFVFFHGRYTTPILMYHSVDPQALPANRLAVTQETLDRQMSFLKRHGYRVIPLEELAALIRGRRKIPARAVVITFDDGYRNFYTYAFPVLKKYNIPATMFIITNEVGRPQGDRLEWGQILEMRDSGIIAFGSHATGPDPLVKIKSAEELRRQIFDSKRILEEKLGRKIDLFSYPEGMYDAKIKQLVIDAGYAASVGTYTGLGAPADDVFALKRIRVSESASNMFIFAAQTSGFYTFIREYQKEKKRKRNAKR